MTSLPFTPHEPWLAPLAGYSDLAFRLLCRERGAAICCTEMISAKGLLYDGPGTRDLVRSHPLDTPLVAQLFGSEPEILARAAERLLTAGFTLLDLNMGCSVRKVIRTGAGAALLQDIPKALAAAKALVSVAGLGRVGFKLRLGRQRGEESWSTLAPVLAEAGAAWISLHPRYAEQGFTGTADWSVFRKLAALVPIPVMASGDLFTAEDGLRCLTAGGPSGVMYARGALRDPTIFTAHRILAAGGCPAPATADELRRLILRHAELARAYGRRGERGALLQMRTIVPRYIRRLPRARLLRRELCRCTSWTHFEELMDSFFTEICL